MELWTERAAAPATGCRPNGNPGKREPHLAWYGTLRQKDRPGRGTERSGRPVHQRDDEAD
jgi:hypothetical protein